MINIDEERKSHPDVILRAATATQTVQMHTTILLNTHIHTEMEGDIIGNNIGVHDDDEVRQSKKLTRWQSIYIVAKGRRNLPMSSAYDT